MTSAVRLTPSCHGGARIPFTFVSDEFNGETVDNQRDVRPHMSRSFSSLSQAEEENGQSRIYLGIANAFLRRNLNERGA